MDLSVSLINDFEKLKISAFSKLQLINNSIHEVTIGPNSTLKLVENDENETDGRTPTSKRVPKAKTPRRSTGSQTPCRQVISELDQRRQDIVDEVINQRYKIFNEFTEKQQIEQSRQWERQKQVIMYDMQAKEQRILQALEQFDLSKSKQNEQLVRHHQEMVEKKRLYEEQLEKTREKQRLLKQNIEQINKHQIEFRQLYQEVANVIKSSPFFDDLKRSLGDAFKQLKSLPDAQEELIKQCRGLEITESHVLKSGQIVAELQHFKLQIDAVIDEMTQRKRQLEEEAAAKKARSETAAALAPQIEQCISQTNLQRYSAIKTFFSEHTNAFQDLLNDDTMKQFRFDCKKAINIPVNAISAVSADHLRDKYVRLFNLLSGKNVSVGDKQFHASSHPQGIAFCMDLLAEKFVLQCDLMISGNPEAAFCYASIIVTLWNDFPTFGYLLLGHFYSQCPYLIPFNIPKTEGQSDEDYFKSLGYIYANNQIEKQHKYVKRMTGIMRLYFSIFIAKPRRGQAQNPHDIKNAWSFFVSVLKLQPQFDITATTFHVFLEVVGWEMEGVYGGAFRKLVSILEKFIGDLKKVDSGGPVSRLEVLLQEYRSSGRFEKPKGVLPANFW